MAEFKIELGKKVKDSITGFSGVVTGRADYITGCRQYCVTPRVSQGKMVESNWIDEDRLLKKPSEDKNNGGPQAFMPPAR